MIVATPYSPDPAKAFSGSAYGSSMSIIGRRFCLHSFHQVDPGFGISFDGVTYTIVRRHDAPGFDASITEVSEAFPGWYALGDALLAGEDCLLAGMGKTSSAIPGTVEDGQPGWSYTATPVWATNVVTSITDSTWTTTLDPPPGAPATEGQAATNDSGGTIVTIDGGSGDYLLHGIITDGSSGAYNYGARSSGIRTSYMAGWIDSILRPSLTLQSAAGVLFLRADRSAA